MSLNPFGVTFNTESSSWLKSGISIDKQKFQWLAHKLVDRDCVSLEREFHKNSSSEGDNLNYSTPSDNEIIVV